MLNLPSPRRLWLFMALVVFLSMAFLFGGRPDSASSATQSAPSGIRSNTSATSIAATPTASTFLSVLPTPTRQVEATATPPVVAPRGASSSRVWAPYIRYDAAPIRYGWKGIADPRQVPSANSGNGFWGLYPDWYYNWVSDGPWTSPAEDNTTERISTIEQMDLAMEDPAYVPMIWCMDDVNGGPTPQEVATLAKAHPGRVWLVFNEPDLNSNGDNCGYLINKKYPLQRYYSDNYVGLGKYLASQYIRYYDAITAADPLARLYAFGGTRTPGGLGDNNSIGRTVWTAFVNYLADPYDEPNSQPRSLDGIAIHTYPADKSTGCSINFTSCLQQVLLDVHKFFQDTPSTAAKSIWITEIGRLEAGGSPATRATKQVQTANVLTQPLLEWFKINAIPGGGAQYFNSLAWFSLHDCRRNPDGSTLDITASDLLYIGVECPLPADWQPESQSLTPIGNAWAAAICPACSCPGLDCPQGE